MYRFVIHSFLLTRGALMFDAGCSCARVCALQPPTLWNTLFAVFQTKTARARAQAAGEVGRAAQDRASSGSSDARTLQEVEEDARAEIRRMLGNKVQTAVTGGAPTAAAVSQFLRDCFEEVVDGYGITETGPVLINGQPVPGVEVKLTDLPALGYSRTDKPFPRGELWVRSSTMASSYFCRESSAFRPDGWYVTGDVALIDENDRVVIIDRVSNCFKLAQGEFVSPEKIEQTLLASPDLSQVWVYGSPFHSYVLAVAVPSQAWYETFRAAERRSGEQKTLVFGHHKAALLQALRELASSQHLMDYEIPRDLCLVFETFSVENGLLTGTSKLNRRALATRFRASLQQCHDALESREHQLERLLRASLGSASETQLEGPFVCGRSFSELGGDSMAAVRFLGVLREHFGHEVSLQSLLSARDLGVLLRSLAMPVEGRIPTVNSASELAVQDLQWELPQRHQKPSTFNAGQDRCGHDQFPSVVFLTGGTGFLGVHLLQELLIRLPDARFLCLVRVLDEESAVAAVAAAAPPSQVDHASTHSHGATMASARATQRLRSSFERFQISVTSSDLDRIQAVEGDLSRPRFGMAESTWAQLCHQPISAILHAGKRSVHATPSALMRSHTHPSAPSEHSTPDHPSCSCRSACELDFRLRSCTRYTAPSVKDTSLRICADAAIVIPRWPGR